MNKRRLGRDGPLVSAVGLGCMGMSGDYGPALEAESVATIRHALDIGVNFLDTSDVYGNNDNERIVGQALSGRRADAVLATKFGVIFNPDGSRGNNGRPEYVQLACNASLKRLGVETIDLYYLHRIDPKVPVTDTVGAMARLVEQGKVRKIGLSEAPAAAIRAAHAVYPISAVQSEYSLFSRDHEGEVIPTCKELGIAFVPFAPLGRAMLADAVVNREELTSGDKRMAYPRFEPGNLERNRELLAPFRKVAAELNCTPAQLALAWLLAQGDQIIPIPGTRKRAHLDSNAAAASIVLNDAHRSALDQAYPPGIAAGGRASPGRAFRPSN
jgi:aryl-alcohol dehydrogenase-like predicted oxidoreductase